MILRAHIEALCDGGKPRASGDDPVPGEINIHAHV